MARTRKIILTFSSPPLLKAAKEPLNAIFQIREGGNEKTKSEVGKRVVLKYHCHTF